MMNFSARIFNRKNERLP